MKTQEMLIFGQRHQISILFECKISAGTRTYSFIDGDTYVAQHSYLLAVKEKISDEAVGGGRTYGVCFVDTSIGKFHVSHKQIAIKTDCHKLAHHQSVFDTE